MNKTPSNPSGVPVAILLLASVATYWLLMMPAHELGHILHALATGGHVTRVILHPLAFSRTDVSPNPSPLAVVWGGPLWGTLLPIGLWLLWRSLRLPAAKWLQGLAAFCAIANGLYLASGVIIPAGDTEDLLRLGTPAWTLAATGLPTIALGFWIAHRMGGRFGVARIGPQAAKKHAFIAVAGCIVAAAGLFAVGHFTSAKP
jgi:hypothetical protein